MFFKFLSIFAFLVIVGLFSYVKSVSAFSSVLGSRVALTELKIDGILVEDSETPIKIKNPMPFFSGYTAPNVKLVLSIHSNEEILREALTDANGYWSYTLNKELEAGDHTLHMQLIDEDGNQSDMALAAKFTVVSATEKAKPESVSTSMPSFLWFIIIILGSLLLLLSAYLIVRKNTFE